MGEGNYAIKEYEEYVKKLAQDKSREIIANGFPEHAQALIAAMLENTKNEICILSSDIRNDIYGKDSVIEELKNFLSRMKKGGTKSPAVRLVLQDINSKGSEIYNITNLEELRKKRRFIDVGLEYPEYFKISKSSANDSERAAHLAVMDKDGYRFCPDKTVTEAIACFNDTDLASHLHTQFNHIFRRATLLNSEPDQVAL